MREALKNGKTITDAYTHDLPGAIGQFEYFAGAAFHLSGQVSDVDDSILLTWFVCDG